MPSGSHLAHHPNHPFAPQRPGLFDQRGAALGREDDLRLAVAIPHVDEQHAAVVAVRVDPPAKRHFLADVIESQFAASVRA